MSNDVVYEHPDHPVDERAEFLSRNIFGWPLWATSSEATTSEGFAPGAYQEYLPSIPRKGHPWRKLIRMSDPAYYCTENPHTTVTGLLYGGHIGRPTWLSPYQRVRAWVRGGDGCTYSQERLAGVVDWKRVTAMRVLTPKPSPKALRVLTPKPSPKTFTPSKTASPAIQNPQDAAMLDAIAEELVKDILGLRGASTEDIFGIAPDPKPKLHRTNKLRQRRRVLARGSVGLRGTVLQQYWESEDGEHGEWRDVPIVGGNLSDV